MAVIRFRVPFWYKFIMILLWVVSFDLTIFLFYKPLHLILRIFFLILDIIFGVWVLTLFKKEIVIDVEKTEWFWRGNLLIFLRLRESKGTGCRLFSI